MANVLIKIPIAYNLFKHPNLYILEYVAFHSPYGSFTYFIKFSCFELNVLYFLTHIIS